MTNTVYHVLISWGVLVVSCYWCAADEAYMFPHILNFNANWDKSFGLIWDLKMEPKYNKDNIKVTTFSLKFRFLKLVTCEYLVTLAFTAKIHNQFTEEPFYETNMTVRSFLYDWKDMALGRAVERMKYCINNTATCPVKLNETYMATDCAFETNFKQFVMSNDWNLTLGLATPENQVFGQVWAEVFFDDTTINRSKRPSTAQRARRNKTKHN